MIEQRWQGRYTGGGASMQQGEVFQRDIAEQQECSILLMNFAKIHCLRERFEDRK